MRKIEEWKKKMENRVIILDTYGYKRYELVYEDGKPFVYDYGLGCVLEGKEKAEFLKHWIKSTLDSKGEAVVEYGGEENT